MTNRKRVPRTAANLSPRSSRSQEICALFAAEMRGRRERMRELLRLVAIEAARQERTRRARKKREAARQA